MATKERAFEILKKRYDIVEYQQDGKSIKCFKVANNRYVYPACMYGGTDNAFHNLVIVYSDSIPSMQRHDTEEGGQFFPEDYDSKEAMFDAMIEEIEA